MVLVAVAFLSAKAAIGPCTGIAGGQGDPHLYGAHGGFGHGGAMGTKLFVHPRAGRVAARLAASDAGLPERFEEAVAPLLHPRRRPLVSVYCRIAALKSFFASLCFGARLRRCATVAAPPQQRGSTL